MNCEVYCLYFFLSVAGVEVPVMPINEYKTAEICAEAGDKLKEKYDGMKSDYFCSTQKF